VDACVPTSSTQFQCTFTTDTRQCVPPLNFPALCGRFDCSGTNDCRPVYNSSLCPPPTLPNCQIMNCTSRSPSNPTGCMEVSTCPSGSICTSQFDPRGSCVASGPHKRNLDLEESGGSTVHAFTYYILIILVVTVITLLSF
jgi:hypothetical protein